MFLYYINKKKQRAQLKQSISSFIKDEAFNEENGERQIELVEMKKVRLKPKTRIYIVLISILLGVNSFNLILDKLIQIMILLDIVKFDKTASFIFDGFN